MIKVELKKDNEHFKKIAISKPITIKQLITDEKIEIHEMLTFQLDNNYASANAVIDHDCIINCIGLESLEGFRIYEDTAIFIMMKAFHNVFPKRAKLVVEHSIGDGIYCEVFGGYEPVESDAEKLQTEIERIVKRNLPIQQEIMDMDDAIEIFLKAGRKDVVRNLRRLKGKSNNIYRCGDFYDYYIRQLADNTGLISKFEVQFQKPGFYLRLPKYGLTEIDHNHEFPYKLFSVHQEYDKWLSLLKAHNVSDLNKYIEDYTISDVVQIEEALQEKKVVYFADHIKKNSNIKIVLIAGPSSSGKTTFAKRLSVQLRVNGIVPVVIGMDDYFLSRHLTPRKENGDYDFESIDAVDIKLLNDHFNSLLKGKEIELPRYNFVTGKSEISNHKIKLEEDQIIIFEGIHAINEKLTASIPKFHKLKIYISSLNQLNVDLHNRVPTTDSRKLRRIVRDHQFRGYSAEETLERWESIREGEDKNIFPFQEDADLVFNSGLTYEMCVLRKHAKPLLMAISKYSKVYQEAKRLINLLDHMYDIPDEKVPNNSLIREFIGGSLFNY